MTATPNQERIDVAQKSLFLEPERLQVENLAQAMQLLSRANLGWYKDSWTAETSYHWSIGEITIASGRDCYRGGPKIEQVVSFTQGGKIIAQFMGAEARKLFECHAEKHRIPY